MLNLAIVICNLCNLMMNKWDFQNVCNLIINGVGKRMFLCWQENDSISLVLSFSSEANS